MVLAVVVLRELFPSDAVAAVRDDAVAAFFWVANWVFVFRRTDYFTQGDPPSPLQHTWSLGGRGAVLRPVAAGAGGRRRRAGLLAAPRRSRSCARSVWSSRRRRRGCGGIGGGVVPDGAPTTLAQPRLLRHRHPRAGAARRRRGGGAAGAGLAGAGALRRADPVALGPRGRADTSGHRAGDARRRRALRDGQCAGVPPRPADRGGRRRGRSSSPRWRWISAGSSRACWPSAAGLARHDLLRRLPLALAGLPRAQRRAHRPDGHVAVRDPRARDGDARRGVVVADRAADQALAARARSAVARSPARRWRPRPSRRWSSCPSA